MKKQPEPGRKRRRSNSDDRPNMSGCEASAEEETGETEEQEPAKEKCEEEMKKQPAPRRSGRRGKVKDERPNTKEKCEEEMKKQPAPRRSGRPGKVKDERPNTKEKCEEKMKKQPEPRRKRRRRNSNGKNRPNMSECEASAEKKKGETEEREQDVPSEIQLVLLGKTGSGKSAAGNTILGREVFKAMFCGSSVTKECGKKKGAVAHTNISVVDTPGLFDTDFTEHEVKKEIQKCVALSAPGPHAFLLVVQLGRFTEEERRTVEKIEEIFGDRAASYTMVLFTYGDRLKDTTIEKYIEGAGVGLQQLVQRCGNRYHVFNNEETSNRTQVTELLNKIKTMVSENGGSSYTNEMYQEVERIIREKEKELKRHYEAELHKKKEELEAKFQKKIDELKGMKQKLDKLEEEMERCDEKIKEMQEKHSQELEEFKRFYKDKDRNAREEAEKSNPILEAVRKVMKLFTTMEI